MQSSIFGGKSIFPISKPMPKNTRFPFFKRSQRLQRYLTEKRISKVVLVPGQVEDDASIIYGADGMTNLELLKATRENAPDAYIVYKPHPDVLAGNRKGHVDNKTARHYCDTIITDASLDSILDICDAVHTMTSLVGFEALVRKKSVTTYGLPFYAGWGLTTDSYNSNKIYRLAIQSRNVLSRKLQFLWRNVSGE